MNILDHLFATFDDFQLGLFNKHFQEILPYSRLQTIQSAIQNNHSIIRYGDGELELVRLNKYKSYQGLRFQKKDSRLFDKLENILYDPIPGVILTLNFILQQPYNPIVLKYERSEKKYDYFESIHYQNDIGVLNRKKSYAKWKNRFNKIFEKMHHPILGDATCFILCQYVEEYKSNSLKNVFDAYSTLMAKKNILFVAPEKPLMGMSFDELCSNKIILSPKRVEFLHIPPTNCFEQYDQIVQNILKYRDIERIFIQAGPTATVIGAELMREYGRAVIDVGSWNVSMQRAYEQHNITF